jgi:hypothetical protein
MDNKKNWIIIVVAILALGGGGYGACVAMTDGAQENLIDDSVADPGVDPPPMPEYDAGLAVEIETPEANPVEVPTEPMEGVIAQPEIEEMPENVVQQALPPQTILEGVPQQREEPCDGDPTCESERQQARQDHMTNMEPGPVN